MNDIFQDLACVVDAAYISDLQEKVSISDMANFLNSVEESKYSIQSWNEVFYYIFGKNHGFSDINEIKILVACQ